MLNTNLIPIYAMKFRQLLFIILLLFLCLNIAAGTIYVESKVDSSIAVYNKMVLEKLIGIDTIQHNTWKAREEAIKKRKEMYSDTTRSEFELMSNIEENTGWNFVFDGFGLIALVSLVVSGVTYWEQRKTQKHTQKASISAQLGRLYDLPRHCYRNMVCTAALLMKYRQKSNMKGNKFEKYPSEANLLKLKPLPDEIWLDIDVVNDDLFTIMHEQKLLLKNYNIEIDVASEHFSRKEITEDCVINDIDNLLFKPMFIIGKTYSQLYRALELKNKKKKKREIADTQVVNIVYSFVKEHFEKIDFGKLRTNGLDLIYKDVINDEVFENYLNCEGKSVNGIKRSCNNLFRTPDKISELEFISWENGGCYIDKKKFCEYFFKTYKKNALKAKTISETEIDEKLNIHHLKIISTLYKKHSELIYILYKIPEFNRDTMKEYFEFWAEDKWEVNSLIYNMLKIDAVLEMPVIGMIKHD